MMHRALVVSFTLIALSYALDGWSCSCISGGGVRESLEHADAVFLGEVTDVRRAEPEWMTQFRFLKARVLHSLGIEDGSLMHWYNGPRYGMIVTLDVLQDWKGSLGKTVELHTGYGGGDCGFSFDVMKEYIVYAYYAGGSYFTGICSRTTSASTKEVANLDAAIER